MLKPNKYPKVVTTAAASLLLMGAGALVNNNVHADEVHNNVPTAKTVQNNGKVIQHFNNDENNWTEDATGNNIQVPYSIDSSKINATQANISNHLADQQCITHLIAKGNTGQIVDSNLHPTKDFNWDSTNGIVDVYGNKISEDVLHNNNTRIAKKYGIHIGVSRSQTIDGVKWLDYDDPVDKNGVTIHEQAIKDHRLPLGFHVDVNDSNAMSGDPAWANYLNNINNYKLLDWLDRPVDTSQAKDQYYSDTINNTVSNNTNNSASHKSESVNGTTAVIANSSSAIKGGNVISSNTSVSANTIATSNGYHVSNNGQAVIDKNGNVVSGWTVAANGQMVSPEGQMITAKDLNNNSASQPAMSQLSNNTVANTVNSSESNNIVASKANNSAVSNSNSTAIKESASNAKSSANSAKLPQTNETNSNEAVAAGLGLLSLTGLFGLGYRRRH